MVGICAPATSWRRRNVDDVARVLDRSTPAGCRIGIDHIGGCLRRRFATTCPTTSAIDEFLCVSVSVVTVAISVSIAPQNASRKIHVGAAIDPDWVARRAE